jgi:mRNA-degrading endonuclease RelE of RelBE toxin-antitoxin system
LSEDSPAIQTRLTPEFEDKFKALKKRYRRIQADIKPIFEDLEAGLILGDQFPGFDSVIMKVRVKNSDAQRGKSGGYRLIYWILSAEIIVMLDIYSKSDQQNVTVNEVRQIIKNFKLTQENDSNGDQ